MGRCAGAVRPGFLPGLSASRAALNHPWLSSALHAASASAHHRLSDVVHFRIARRGRVLRTRVRVRHNAAQSLSVSVLRLNRAQAVFPGCTFQSARRTEVGCRVSSERHVERAKQGELRARNCSSPARDGRRGKATMTPDSRPSLQSKQI